MNPHEALSQLELDKKGQIIRKPKCGTPNCENDGWIFFEGKFRCGECVSAAAEAAQKAEAAGAAERASQADEKIKHLRGL